MIAAEASSVPEKSPKSPRAAAFISLQALLIAAAAWTLIAVQSARFADDPGIGWHLATGELILRSFSIPDTDPFLFSYSERPWVADQWLADIVLFVSYRLASWPGVYALGLVVYLAAYFLILHPQLSKLTGSALAGLVASLIAFKLGQIHFIARPVIFNPLFFAVVFAAAIRLKSCGNSNEAKSLLKRQYVILPALFLVWANFHGSFVLGLIVLGILILTSTLEVVVRRPMSILSRAKFLLPLLGLVICCLLATVINPYGLTIHRNILTYTQNEYFMQLMTEWRPLDLSSFEGRTTVFGLAFVTLCFGVFHFKKLSWSFFEPLLVLVFAYYAFGAVRVLPFLGIVLAWPIASGMGLILRQISANKDAGSGISRKLVALLEWENSANYGRLASSTIVVVILVAGLFFKSIPFYSGQFGPSQEAFPYKAIEFLANEARREPPIVVAAHPNWGGFIIFYGKGLLKPIIDDRNPMLGVDFYKEFFSRLSADGARLEYLTEIGATHLLIASNEPLLDSINQSREFALLYADEVSHLFRLGESSSLSKTVTK